MIHEVDGFPGREIMVGGEPFLYFGGTAYLGLQTDKAFQEILIKNIKKFGTNYGASRKANVRIPIYEKAESYLANLVGSENSITLSSGYLAGQLIAKYLHSKNHECFYAPKTHEALHILSTKNYARYKNLVNDLNTSINNGGNPVLFLDSISLNGKNHPDFNWLRALELHKINLVVDDSHGLGIVGENGGGVYRFLKTLKPKSLVVCGSLGKSLGIPAGILVGSNQLIHELRSSDMFAAASPANAATIATILESQKIIIKKREVLFENIDYFLSYLPNQSFFEFLPEYPCFSFENSDLTKYLANNDIIITSFYYPTEKDDLVQRIVLSAHHTKEDLKKLVAAINGFFSSWNLPDFP